MENLVGARRNFHFMPLRDGRHRSRDTKQSFATGALNSLMFVKTYLNLSGGA